MNWLSADFGRALLRFSVSAPRLSLDGLKEDLVMTTRFSLRATLAALAAAPLFLALPTRAAEGDEKPAANPPGTYELRIRTAAPQKSPWGELLTNLTNRIKKDIPPGITLNIKVHWQTKSEAAAVRSCVDGKSGGIAVSFGALAAAVPELDATEVPFLFEDYKQADKALNKAFPLMSEIMRKKGFIYAVRGENGFRQWASKSTQLTRPEHFKGRAMRSQPSAIHKAMYSALGATPNPLQISDVPTNLEQGKIDGYDNTLLFAKLANWTENVTFVTISNHIYQGAAVVWCEAWFKDLPKALQDILTKRDSTTDALETTGLGMVRAFNDRIMPKQYTEDLKKKMHTLTSAERDAFKKALAGVEAGFRKGASPDGVKLMDLLKANR